MSIEAYYLQQAAGLPSFAGPLVQQGHGIGGIFKSLFRSVIPLFRSAAPVLKKVAKTAAKEVVRTGANVVDDVIDGERISDALAKRGNEAFQRTVRRGTKRIRKLLSGPASGRVQKKRARKTRDIFTT